MSLYHPNIMIAWITLWDTNFISFPWWMVMTTIYYCRSFWVQNTFSLLLAKPPIYCMGGKYFFSSGCLVIMSLLFYKWNRCRYVIVHYDTMLLLVMSCEDREMYLNTFSHFQIYLFAKVYLIKHHFSVMIFKDRTSCKNNVLLSLKQTFSFNVISSINRMKGR